VNTYLEDLIRDALRHQAGRAAPPERILATLPVREARRSPVRRRGALIAAACAVALVVAALPVAVHLGTRRAPVTGAGDWSGTVPDFAHLKSPVEVWPDAVHQIPDVLPGGTRYTVSAVLGRGRYVVRADAGASTPMVLDSRAGTARPVSTTAVRPPDGADLKDVFVAAGQVWWGQQMRDGPYELWSASLDGGSPPRLVVRWPLGEAVYPIGVQDGVTFWRHLGGRGVPGIYRMPLESRAPELVAGTEEYQDFGAFPWLSSVGPAGDVPRGRLGPRTGELLNVVTGERRGWTAHPDATGVDCNPVLCLGLDGDGRATVQRLDGSGFQRIPYGVRVLPYEQTMGAGRFGVGSFLELGGKSWIWDRVTGAAAAMPRAYLHATVRMPTTVVEWEEPGRARYVLDLAAIR
jgi:hypothetical protein